MKNSKLAHFLLKSIYFWQSSVADMLIGFANSLELTFGVAHYACFYVLELLMASRRHARVPGSDNRPAIQQDGLRRFQDSLQLWFLLRMYYSHALHTNDAGSLGLYVFNVVVLLINSYKLSVPWI